MTYLLKSTSLFLSLPNLSFVQLAGKPLQHVISAKRFLAAQSDYDQRQRKRKLTVELSAADALPPVKKRKTNVPEKSDVRTSKQGSWTMRREAKVRYTRRSAMDIPIQRYIIFYSQPTRTSGFGIKFGFPSKHVLSSFDEQRQMFKRDSLETPPAQAARPRNPIKSDDELNLERHGRHLLMHIFPRQYGLRSVFSVNTVRDAPTWRMKEINIKTWSGKRGKRATPHRLKVVLPLAVVLLRRHSQCSYTRILSKVCPSKTKRDQSLDPCNDATAQGSVLQIVSEVISQPLSLSSLDVSHPSLIVLHGRKPLKLKPRFPQYACNYFEASAESAV
ncbi:uncharacterized protein EI90DRAFT_3029093, partial [Cantharellus anzutake]|uniref:uncharacterized protein n=1 Tax=Cantharellus anzutake TaxID=1750568 RepID=UPI00190396B0